MRIVFWYLKPFRVNPDGLDLKEQQQPRGRKKRIDRFGGPDLWTRFNYPGQRIHVVPITYGQIPLAPGHWTLGHRGGEKRTDHHILTLPYWHDMDSRETAFAPRNRNEGSLPGLLKKWAGPHKKKVPH